MNDKMYTIIEEMENIRETVKNLSNFYYHKNEDEDEDECKLDMELSKKLESIVRTCLNDVFAFLEESFKNKNIDVLDKTIGKIHSMDFEPLIEINKKSSIEFILEDHDKSLPKLPENWKSEKEEKETVVILTLTSTNINDILIDLEKLISVIC